MALKPETIARLQGILDGTIKVEPVPAERKEMSPEMKAELAKIWDEAMEGLHIPVSTPQPTYEDEDPLHMDEPDAQELSGADEIIQLLADEGHGDYSAFRKEIALDIYANGHYAGNNTAYFVASNYDANSTLQDFYVIQEDHYDQHMDEDEDKPSWDSMVAMVQNGYLWMS